MSSLGFRGPQFSEDFAWLPTWLQNPQLEASTNSFKDPKSNFSQVETLPREEGRYNSCPLFLSGDDTSQITLPPSPSPGNVLHLCLRLSSDGESQDSRSKSIDASKALYCSSEVPSVQQVGTSADLQERVRLSKEASDRHEASHFSPLSAPTVVENVFPQSRGNDDEIEWQCGNLDGAKLSNSGLPASECPNPSSPTEYKENRVHEEKFDVRNMKDSDVSEAVELSVAASEALVINELMRTEAIPDIVTTEIVLEAALQVKKARLEALRDSITFSSHEIDDIDFLSDLDDLTMENAFRDVGLVFEGLDDQHDYLDVSQVKDTPMSENLNVHNDEPEHVQLMAQQDNVCDGSALGLNNCELGDPILDHPAEKISDVLAAVQPQIDARSSPACLSENTGGEIGACSLVNKFRSRWLGGWAVKEAVVPEEVERKSAKGLSRFHCETSSLSESGGVAADEYSFVQNYEIGSKVPSQSSKPFEGALSKADEGNLNSQEVRSSNQSMADPLCSVVPCSISMEHAVSPSVKNQDDGEANAQNNFNPKSDLGMENCLNFLDLNNESEPVDREALPTINGESSEATVRRKQASLKTYRTLLPKHDVVVNGQRIFQHQHLSSEYGGELLLSNQNAHCHSDCCKKNSNLTLRFEHEYSGGGGHGLNQEASAFVVPADHDEPAKDGDELQFQRPVQRKSPRILNRKVRCRLHPPELHIENLDGKKSPEPLITQGIQSKVLLNKKFQNIKSTLENPHSAPNKVRKRVHFTEDEMEHQHNRDIQKPLTSQRNCSAIRAKKSKYSMLQSGSLTKDMKNCFTNQINEKNVFVFQGQEFLLTGFSSLKEREIVRLINEYGGMVLSDIPSLSSFGSRRSTRSNFHQLPIVISSKKLQTTKFLYGCAVNALILKVKWLAGSIAACSRLPPEKYIILPNRAGLPCTEFGKSYHYENSRRILDKVGIMLHGKPSFCTKLALIIKHGGGQVFKTLQRMFESLDGDKISVGAIISEDDNNVSRHLKHCASERKLAILPASWIAKSLHLGKLLYIKEKEDIPAPRATHSAMALDWSQEI